jgi:hypothetical protein
MKIKSVSGITCYVKNLNKTAKFYETLGFDIRKREATTSPRTRTGSGWTSSPPTRNNGPLIRSPRT